MHKTTRREMLRTASCGFGLLALNGLAGRRSQAAGFVPPLQPRAKRVIFLCMSGGPAQMDTFDYKPQTGKKPHPGSGFEFARHGQSGNGFPSCFPSPRGTSTNCAS